MRDGTTGVPLPEGAYIGDPLPTPSPPSWVIPIGKVTPLAGVGSPELPEGLPDYSSALAVMTRTLDRIGQELALLREQVVKLAAPKRRRKR
jgi:hypothetical protein